MIDWTHLDALRAELGAAQFDELVAVFLEEADRAVAGLRDDAGGAALAAELHFLKGAALNLGLEAFARLCSAGEAAAGQALPVDLDPIRTAYRDSRSALCAGLEKRWVA